jgi:ABC-type phosphate/phosphonate transport system permease subunit
LIGQPPYQPKVKALILSQKVREPQINWWQALLVIVVFVVESFNFSRIAVSTMAGLEPNIYWSTAITWIAASVAMVMRFMARRITKQPWWWDDTFCVLTYVGSPSA